MLLERDRELDAVAALVAAAGQGRGGVLWIEGPAGIGKTRLVDAARDRARSAGMRVLEAQASDLESEFAFGVVRSLFEPALAGAPRGIRDDLLAGAARLAAPVLSLDELAPDSGSSQGTLHGLYWLAANLADHGPLLLTIDDAHWSDAPSLRALAYLARRIAELPIGLVVAARPPPGADGALLDAVRDRAATVLRPGPLSRDGTDALVRELISPGSAEEFRAACHDATGGNPLLVRALLRVLADAGVTPDEHGVRMVAERAPAVVATSVARRLRHAGPDATAVAAAVAVLAGGAQLRHVAAVTGLDPGTVADAADSLVGARMLLPGRPLAFAHSMVEQAVADRMTPAERHRGHREAARVLAAEGAAAELVAAHLLHTESLGDPEVVDALRAAARIALAKGAPETAMTYLRRARDEPPPSSARTAVLFELGSATVRVSFTDGVALLEQACATATDPRQRARIALELVRALRVTLHNQRALAVLDDAIAGLGDGDPGLALELEVESVGLARRDPDRRAAALERTRALHEAGRLEGPGAAVLLANSALDALLDGGGPRAVALAGEALESTLARDVPDPGVLLPATTVLVATDSLDEMRATCETMIASARARGSIADFASASVLRAQTCYLSGELAEAEADARVADELTAEHEVHYARRYTQAWLVLVLVERGRLDEAEASLRDSGVQVNLAYLLDARGQLRLAQGRPGDALDDFTECGARLRRRGMHHPGLTPWQANSALALYQLGHLDEAQRAADEAAEGARQWSVPRALGVALRARGLVCGALGPLREAVAVLEATPARLEHGRALVDLGAALRRDNQRGVAREALARGREIAARCAAEALAERAREELLAAGARPRTVAVTGPDALTASERRVARLAADGMSNRGVAQSLFVSTKTVETHLGHVYRKLRVDGRDELAGALA